MQISTKHGFAFLCMPKSASTSIESAIKDSCNINFSGHTKLKHINAQLFSEQILPACQAILPSVDIKSFCLIREPLDWVASWYLYRSRSALKKPSHPNHKKYTGNISYNAFITAYISKEKREPFAKIRTQYDFLKLRNGEIGVDQIIPMDRLDLVAKMLSEKTGNAITIPKKNISPKDMVIDLDPNLEEKLRQYLVKDIAIYEFIKQHEQFNRLIHASKISATLQGL